MDSKNNKQKNSINFIIGPTVYTEARRLRSEGCSLRDISRALDIPITSLRRITKDIKLSEEQRIKLLSKKRKSLKKVIRIDYQDEEVMIDAKINIKSFKRKRFNKNLDNTILKYILDSI